MRGFRYGSAGLVGQSTCDDRRLALFCVGFGVGQNVALALMFERVPRSEYGRVSALWNLAYDAGMGIGAVGFGLLIGPIGYAAGFAVTAALVMISLAVPDRNRP